jgi:hypothetical protein
VNYQQTGLGETNGDLLEADFWTVSSVTPLPPLEKERLRTRQLDQREVLTVGALSVSSMCKRLYAKL